MLYGILLWGKSDNVHRIEKLQKKALRVISYSRPLEHTEPLFKAFNLLKFNDIYTLKLLKYNHLLDLVGLLLTIWFHYINMNVVLESAMYAIL